MTRGFKRRSSSMGSACEAYVDKPSQRKNESNTTTKEEDLETARKLLSSLLYIKDASGRSYLHTDFRLSWAKALLKRAKELDEGSEHFLNFGANSVDQYRNGRSRKFSSSQNKESTSGSSSTLMQRRFLLQADQESGYTPFHRAILEGNLAAMLLFLRHATADELSTTERLTQRPMTLLHAAEANHGHNNSTTNKNKRLNNPLLLAMAKAVDHEGMTPLRLLGRLQQPELFHCRKHLQSFRHCVDRNATMRLRTRQRHSSFDNSGITTDEGDDNIDFFSENADLLGEASDDEDNGSATGGGVSYACEVVTFGRPQHCALGVVQGLGQASSAFSSASGEDNSNQKYSHGSGFCPQRVQEFAQEIVGREGSAMAVAAATHHTLVVTKKGHLYAFGLEKGGRLGLGDDQPKQCPLPKRVLGPIQRHQVVSVAAAENHSLCVTSRGDLFSWGSNRFGQLGDHSTGGSVTTPGGSRSLPRRVEDLKQHPCVAVAAGEKHSVALSRKGEVYVWGDNTSGQLGVPRRSGIQKVQRVEALWGTSVVQGSNNNRSIITIAIAAAEQSTLVLTTGSPSSRLTNVNAIYEWGHGNHVPMKIHFESSGPGATGNNRQSSFGSSFSRTPNPTAIACARYHNAAITSDGLVYTWGLRAESLGRENTNAKSSKQQHQRRNSSPQLVTGMLSEKGGGFAVAIDASGSHTAVVCDDGALFTWGTTDGNNVYNLGHEGVRWQPNPKRVPGVHRAVDVAVAKEHTILLIGSSFPSFPKSESLPSLEVLAARKVAEYVDLFNVIPILIMAERTESSLLVKYCTAFVRSNLDGVLNVGKKSVMNQYLNDVLSETSYRSGKRYRDDHHHPIIFDVLAAGNVGRPTFDHDWFSSMDEWIEGCRQLGQSPIVRRLLEVATVREYEEDVTGMNSKARRKSSCHKEYCEFKARTCSHSESTSTHTKKEGSIDRGIRKTANMNLSTLELANENSAWLSKEVRGIRKKIKQISNLLDAETREVVLSPEQKAKVSRLPVLETELSIYESATAEVQKRIHELNREKNESGKQLSFGNDSLRQQKLKAQDARIDENDGVRCSVDEKKGEGQVVLPSKKKQTYFCDVCGTKCSDKSSFILHQNGRKHRNRVAQLLEHEKEKTAASIQEQQQMELMKSFKSSPMISTPPIKSVENAWGVPVTQPKYKLPPPPHPVLSQVVLPSTERVTTKSRSYPSEVALSPPVLAQKKSPKHEEYASKKIQKAITNRARLTSPTNAATTTSNFANILAVQEIMKKHTPNGKTQSMEAAVWHSSPSSTRCVPLSMYESRDNALIPDEMKINQDRKQSISLADFLTPRKKIPSSSPTVAPWMVNNSKVALQTPPNTKSIAQIQAEEETLRSKQDKSYGKGGGSWYVERRERAESVLEIQKIAQEDLEHRRLVEEQLQIEAQIKEENDRRQKLLENSNKCSKGKGTLNRKTKKKNNSDTAKPNAASQTDVKSPHTSKKQNRRKGKNNTPTKSSNRPSAEGSRNKSKPTRVKSSENETKDAGTPLIS